MSVKTDKLKEWDADCKVELEIANDRVNAVIESDADSFRHNTLENIPQNFGDFLYTSLGDRVAGQRSSVLNKVFIEETDQGKKIAKMAEDANQTVEEYFKSHNCYNLQILLTAGRKFGVSYYTGSNGRVHTRYFGKGRCFANLTQGHVDCIKNKRKRKCVQSFLNYRNEFISEHSKLSQQLVPVDISAKLAVISAVTAKKKINAN